MNDTIISNVPSRAENGFNMEYGRVDGSDPFDVGASFYRCQNSNRGGRLLQADCGVVQERSISPTAFLRKRGVANGNATYIADAVDVGAYLYHCHNNRRGRLIKKNPRVVHNYMQPTISSLKRCRPIVNDYAPIDRNHAVKRKKVAAPYSQSADRNRQVVHLQPKKRRVRQHDYYFPKIDMDYTADDFVAIEDEQQDYIEDDEGRIIFTNKNQNPLNLCHFQNAAASFDEGLYYCDGEGRMHSVRSKSIPFINEGVYAKSRTNNVRQKTAKVKWKCKEENFLPMSEIVTLKDFKKFMNQFSDEKYKHLCNASIWNLVFIFEQLKDNTGAYTKTALTSLGKASLERWKHTRKIHVMFPAKHQLYLLKTAVDPHYQILLKDFLEKVSEFNSDLHVQFYSPQENHSSEMLYILNNESAERFVNQVNWDPLMKRMEIDAANEDKGDISEYHIPKKVCRQAAGNGCSYGTCHNHSMAKDRDANGNSRPNIKATTYDPNVLKAFLALSKAAEAINPSWRPTQKYSDILPDDYLMKFAHKIHEDNIFANLHAGRTSVLEPCGCHNDGKTNSPLLPEVLCVSRIANNERHSVNGQQRKSIDDFFKRSRETANIYEAISQIIDEMPESRKLICRDMLNGKKKSGLKILFTFKTSAIFQQQVLARL